jgi:hypothetical protein
MANWSFMKVPFVASPEGVEQGVAGEHDHLLEEAAGVLGAGRPRAVELGRRGQQHHGVGGLREGRRGVGREGGDARADRPGGLRGAQDARGRPRPAGRQEEVARRDRGRRDLADDVDPQPQVHQAHGGHAERETGAAGAEDEDALGPLDRGRRRIEVRVAHDGFGGVGYLGGDPGQGVGGADVGIGHGVSLLASRGARRCPIRWFDLPERRG